MTPAVEQPPLWPDDWEVEPCDTAPPSDPVRLPLCLRDIETVRPIDDYPEGTET